MTYVTHERVRATAWKTRTTALPVEAKLPARYVREGGTADGPEYGFCLPAACADHNLLVEVREDALRLFAELGIPWHAGVADGPSNHLLSSQVQCVNALGQMVADPSRIMLAFGDLLEIDEVLQIEAGRYLTFEYIGPTDFFGESPGRRRTRGAHCTSVDAAFLHRARDGAVELVLVEWKYTESYRPRRPDPAKDAVRLGRYGPAVADPGGPVRADVLAFEYLLDEPFYQITRQQLLAHALECSGAEGASRVRVVHVTPAANEAYQRSLARVAHRALGGTVKEVWRQLQRRPERFLSLDSDVFLDPEVTSTEYALRYSDDVVWDQEGLLGLAGSDVEDYLYCIADYDGDVHVDAEEVELHNGGVGTPLAYPFRLSTLVDLCPEVEAEAEERAEQLEQAELELLQLHAER